jgi:PAS domain S-box-containing protein
MMIEKPPEPEWGSDRATALHKYAILDTPPEAAFDRFADLATHVFDTPMAVVSFIDGKREWIKARRNFDQEELPIDASPGINVLRSDGPLVVEDTHDDIRFAANPIVTEAPGVRFYAGAALVTPDGVPIGTIAVMDTSTGRLSTDERAQLGTLASLVMETLETHATASEEETGPASFLTPSHASTAVLDADGVVVESTEHGNRFAALSERGANYLDLLASSIGEAGDAALAKKAKIGLEAVLQGEKRSFEIVFPAPLPDEDRWFHMHALRLDHPPARAVVTHQNVTNLEQHDRRRRFLETAVEQAQEVVLITEGAPLREPGPRILYVNPAFTEITGYSPDEVIGKTPRLLQGPDTEPWVIDEMRECLEQGEPFEGEAINYRKDGTPYVNQWSIAPVHDPEGTITHWVSVQRDVSNERQMEKRLLWAQERERHRIARTMHDEMGGLLATLQMTLDASRPADPDAAPLDEVRAVASELSGVVRALTERLHSRVLEDYGLSRALPRLVDQFRDDAGLELDLHNELSPDDSLPPLLEQIAYRGLYEALSNVDQHAEADRAQILVNRQEKRVRIHVIDDGTGFAPERQLTSDDQLGLLGLKERIVRLNGKLEIDSAPGAGTRISMTLPITLASLLEQSDRSSAFAEQSRFSQ